MPQLLPLRTKAPCAGGGPIVTRIGLRVAPPVSRHSLLLATSGSTTRSGIQHEVPRSGLVREDTWL